MRRCKFHDRNTAGRLRLVVNARAIAANFQPMGWRGPGPDLFGPDGDLANDWRNSQHLVGMEASNRKRAVYNTTPTPPPLNDGDSHNNSSTCSIKPHPNPKRSGGKGKGGEREGRGRSDTRESNFFSCTRPWSYLTTPASNLCQVLNLGAEGAGAIEAALAT